MQKLHHFKLRHEKKKTDIKKKKKKTDTKPIHHFFQNDATSHQQNAERGIILSMTEGIFMTETFFLNHYFGLPIMSNSVSYGKAPLNKIHVHVVVFIISRQQLK